MSTYLILIFGFAFSKAGMIVLLSASVWVLFPPLPYVPQKVRVTDLLGESAEPPELEHPASVTAAAAVAATSFRARCRARTRGLQRRIMFSPRREVGPAVE